MKRSGSITQESTDVTKKQEYGRVCESRLTEWASTAVERVVLHNVNHWRGKNERENFDDIVIMTDNTIELYDGRTHSNQSTTIVFH